MVDRRMTDVELTARLTEVLVAAQARFRKQRGMGVIVTPIIPNPLIDQVAAGLAPVLQDLVREAVHAELQTPYRCQCVGMDEAAGCTHGASA
jgi:hypothetical protein